MERVDVTIGTGWLAARPGVRRWVSAVLAVLVCAAALRATAADAQQQQESRLLADKTVLITGSTDGLGREVALRAAALGAHVIVHGRNQERGAAVVAEIEKGGAGSARFYAGDLASVASVRQLAGALRRDYPRIDVLVNNAGVLYNDQRRVSSDGHELHFAVNYLSHFLLTRELLPALTAAAPSRIINVASLSQSPIDFSDVMLERPGAFRRGYGQSKLAQIVFTMDLAEELRDRQITVVALHPATLMNTSMVTEAGMTPRATIDEGADAVMALLTRPDLETGQYFNGQTPARANAQAYDANAQRQLRDLSNKLTGL